MSDEYWDRWFERRRRKWPFFRGGPFSDMDEVIRVMEELMERQFEEFSKMTPKGLVKKRTLPDGSRVREFGPFVYGYSMRIGPDGKPEVREFGNVKPGVRYGQPRVNISEEREPLVDVTETDSKVHVIAELPGVEKEDISINATERTLNISVDTKERKYHKELEMPDEVDPASARSSYKNGVLEVTLRRAKEKEPRGVRIKIE